MATQWHEKSPQQVLSELNSDSNGLSAEQVKQKRLEYGNNRLPQPVKPNLLKRFLLQFHNILIYVLLVSAGITFLLGHLIDTAVILAVVLINAIIGLIQEGKAEQAMDAIRSMLAPQAAVIRDGQRHSIAGEDLVPGDIVLLEAGDKVPADLRLLQSHGLQIQEAILTGESSAIDKHIQAVKPGVPLGDRFCMAFSGTTVTSGQGKGVVIGTGALTEIGRISGLLSKVETLTTPLVEQMNVFAKWLTTVILSVAALILGFGIFIQEQSFSELFMAVVGLSVAAIPEGLPAVLTITLAVGVKAMAHRNAIVRRLPAIETLGSVSVICTDKTGTLTRNEMSVASLITAESHFTLADSGYAPVGNIQKEGQAVELQNHPLILEFGRAVTLCNDAELRTQDNEWTVAGDPMEGALLALAGKTGIDINDVRKHWTRTDLIPFDAKHRFMATLNHDHENHAFIFLKGAPEKLLELCQTQRLENGDDIAIEQGFWLDQADYLASQGQRVLAIASKTVEPNHVILERPDLETGLSLLGIVGLIDPPREEAIQAIAECHQAGIRVKMITGDHAATAASIGNQIGLQNPDNVLTGTDLDKLDDRALKEKILQTDIFARTSPEHKLRLVMALQSQGMTVAMTGDGVNDAPALKRADAGIAMGRKGSEAAKEASDLVLADDNFASIAAAVREGRTAYDNIKKVISWTLPTNSGEAATIILAILLGMTLPITPVQILWINLVTATTLGIALAFEPANSHTMRQPPRPRNQPLLDKTLIWQIFLVSSLFIVGVFGVYSHAINLGYSIEQARTMAVNTLVIMEVFQLLYIRNMNTTSLDWSALKATKEVWIAIALVVIAQIAITYIPALQTVFETQALSGQDLLLILAVGIMLFVIIETEKQLRLRYLTQKN
ncbi:MAG: cation-transporting P-type ATPase [Thiomicrorhabdus chilensis]|uniref:cation-transporting P-type ATPase n=1 Tax=Thiomicrorhabdus chilensis TaxID=63656 RepID=UPI00299EDA68|nr:cation-transporting P-type ATPase [Thiomicrorhabdus chilensis]MDX1348396.1 cation-transporting P-type ATPase [Thiomicrorhabdus chilensis]